MKARTMQAPKMYLHLLNYWPDLIRLRHLPPERVRRIQIQRVRRMVEHARVHSPFYRQLYDKAGVSNLEIRTAEDIRALPTVDKQMMREFGVENVLTVDKNAPGISCDMTSGSSGEPFPVYVRRDANFTSHLRVFYTLFRGGYRPHQRFLMVWRYEPDRVFEIERQTLLGSVQKHLGLFRRDILSIYQPPEVLVEAIRRGQPHVLYAVRSVVELMAHALRRKGEKLSVPLILTTAETLLPEHRELFSEVFGSRVINIYGCCEAPTIGVGISNEGFELFPNVVYLEYDNVVDEGGQSTGEIVITNLLNHTMPFIRYRLRDRGRIIDQSEAGLSKFMGPVVGRDDDMIVLPNGFRFAYHHSYHLLYTFTECKQYRFVQTPDGAVHLWLVPTDDSEEGRARARQKVLAIWHDKFPDLPLDVVFKPSLPLGRTGKHRAIERLEASASQ